MPTENVEIWLCCTSRSSSRTVRGRVGSGTVPRLPAVAQAEGCGATAAARCAGRAEGKGMPP